MKVLTGSDRLSICRGAGVREMLPERELPLSLKTRLCALLLVNNATKKTESGKILNMFFIY